VWQWHDLLAALARLAGGGHLAQDPPNAAGSPWESRPNRLVAGLARFGECTRPRGGAETGPNPTDRGKSGSKRHLVVDRKGIPLAVTQSGANVHDSMLLEATVDAIAPIRRPRGRPRKRPAKLDADKGYDFPRCRKALRARGIIPRIARRGIESSERLGRHRWVVERTLSWLNRFRRLTVRYERRADIHQAFLSLGCAMICWKFLQHRLC
jgi:transposase